MRALLKLVWWLVRLLVAIVVVALVVTAVRVVLTGNDDERRASDAIVVLGAAQLDGTPGPVLEARLEHALELQRAGVAPVVVTTGGAAQGDRFTEGGSGRQWLLEQGLTEDEVVAVESGGDTRTSLEATAAVMRDRGWDTAVVVTDRPHLLRSVTDARRPRDRRGGLGRPARPRRLVAHRPLRGPGDGGVPLVRGRAACCRDRGRAGPRVRRRRPRALGGRAVQARRSRRLRPRPRPPAALLGAAAARWQDPGGGARQRRLRPHPAHPQPRGRAGRSRARHGARLRAGRRRHRLPGARPRPPAVRPQRRDRPRRRDGRARRVRGQRPDAAAAHPARAQGRAPGRPPRRRPQPHPGQPRRRDEVPVAPHREPLRRSEVRRVRRRPRGLRLVARSPRRSRCGAWRPR